MHKVRFLLDISDDETEMIACLDKELSHIPAIDTNISFSVDTDTLKVHEMFAVVYHDYHILQDIMITEMETSGEMCSVFNPTEDSIDALISFGFVVLNPNGKFDQYTLPWKTDPVLFP